MLEKLRHILTETWRGLLPSGSKCALALYPDHWNAGDAAIWWGTRKLLAELGVEVRYACDPWSYDPVELRRALPEGPVLLLGGGNFGDVYPPEESLRNRILEDFCSRRIIQLPQSIWFRSQEGIDRMAKLLAAQSDFMLLLRDRESLEFARTRFPETHAALCPDASLALDLTMASANPEVPVLALWRNDSELCGPLPAVPSDWIVRDWTLKNGILPAEEASQIAGAVRFFKEWVGNPPAIGSPCPPERRLAWSQQSSRWDELAEERTLRGCRILTSGRMIVTNRLHAHLLCAMMGKPHVVCDTSNGKVFAYRDTWNDANGSCGSAFVHFANSPAEAVEIAAEFRGISGELSSGES